MLICSLEKRSVNSIKRLQSSIRTPELIIAELWSAENNRPYTQMVPFVGILKELPSPVTDRDEMVANEVIQWLGTACGLNFLKNFQERLRDEGYTAL